MQEIKNCNHCKRQINSIDYQLHLKNCKQNCPIWQEKNNPDILCKICQKYIRHQNFQLHSIKCQKNHKQLKDPLFNIQPSYKKQKKPNLESEILQLIPCPNCGYQQTFEQLDTHPKQCNYRASQCPQCSIQIPLSLLQQHINQCHQNGRHSHIHHHQNPYHLHHHDDDDDEEIYQYNQNPTQRFRLKNSNNFPWVLKHQQQQFDMNRQMSVFERYRQIELQRRRTDPHEIQRSERRRRRQMEQQQYEGARRQGFIVHFPFSSSNHNRIRHIAELISMMSRNHLDSHQQQVSGLTSSEIEKLTIIPYKKRQQNDLCTICYCQFKNNQKITELQCKHLYHPQCINQWLRQNPLCPVCKRSTKEDKNQEDEWQQYN